MSAASVSPDELAAYVKVHYFLRVLDTMIAAFVSWTAARCWMGASTGLCLISVLQLRRCRRRTSPRVCIGLRHNFPRQSVILWFVPCDDDVSFVMSSIRVPACIPHQSTYSECWCFPCLAKGRSSTTLRRCPSSHYRPFVFDWLLCTDCRLASTSWRTLSTSTRARKRSLLLLNDMQSLGSCGLCC